MKSKNKGGRPRKAVTLDAASRIRASQRKASAKYYARKKLRTADGAPTQHKLGGRWYTFEEMLTLSVEDWSMKLFKASLDVQAEKALLKEEVTKLREELTKAEDFIARAKEMGI